MVTGFNEPVYRTITITNRCATQPSTAIDDADTGTNEVVYILNRSSSGRSVIDHYMNSYFTNSDEANCGLTHTSPFSLVDDADVNTSFSNGLVSITNSMGSLSNSYLRIDYPNYGW